MEIRQTLTCPNRRKRYRADLQIIVKVSQQRGSVVVGGDWRKKPVDDDDHDDDVAMEQHQHTKEQVKLIIP